MVKFVKQGRVIIVTRGRFAGRKCVVVQVNEVGNRSHPYSHAIVAGIERNPQKITKKMGTVKQARRSRVKPFIKRINLNHIMPTRYSLELGDALKSCVGNQTFSDPALRRKAKNIIRESFQERYVSGKNSWFFERLRF